MGSRRNILTLGVLVVAVATVGLVCAWRAASTTLKPATPYAVDEVRVAEFCGTCHAVPPPASFPKASWDAEVAQGYRFFGSSGLPLTPPPQGAVARWYEQHAPERLAVPERPTSLRSCPVAFDRTTYTPTGVTDEPAVSNVRFVRLSDGPGLDILACDMRGGRLLQFRPGDSLAAPRVVCDSLHNPCHTEVVDLDGDGRKDILVADLGSFVPSDQKQGSVVWLRGA